MKGDLSLLCAFQDVEDFHLKFGMEIADRVGFSTNKEMRMKLISEEFDEVFDAFKKEDIDNLAQELADLIYVCVGMAVSFGIPLAEVWDEVHKSNMAKVGGTKRPDGKLLKPEGWVAPDVKRLLDIKRLRDRHR